MKISWYVEPSYGAALMNKVHTPQCLWIRSTYLPIFINKLSKDIYKIYTAKKQRDSHRKTSSDSVKGETAAQTVSALSRSFLLMKPLPSLVLLPQLKESVQT